MPDYAAQITVRDRWAIVAYVRALQLSAHAHARRRAGSQREQLDGRRWRPSTALR